MATNSSAWVSEETFQFGFPNSYWCRRSGEDDEISSQTVTLRFDFEFTMPHPIETWEEVYFQDMVAMDYGILYRMAEVTGIRSCNFTKQDDLGSWLPPGNQDDDYRILGLTSWQFDSPQPMKTCQNIIPSKPNLMCVATVGQLNASFTGSDPTIVEDYLMEVLETELNEQNALIDTIEETYFVGKSSQVVPSVRSAAAGGETSEAIRSSSTNNDRFAVAMGVSIAGAASLILAAVAWQRHRRREAVPDPPLV